MYLGLCLFQKVVRRLYDGCKCDNNTPDPSNLKNKNYLAALCFGAL